MSSFRRLLDVAITLAVLVTLSPLLIVAAVGIRLTSPGPIFYRARRIARDRRRGQSDGLSTTREPERRLKDGYWGREFTMYKFRTMCAVWDGAAVPITAHNDARVFPFGRLLRATKFDELPQLFNVLKGDMSLVGPRPEAPEIVRSHYTHDDLKTLQVPPGVTSPGTLHYYTHCESTLGTDDVVDQYVRTLLPAKLALDRVYLERVTLFYDLRIMLRTAAGIGARLLGIKGFPEPPELRHLEANRSKVQTMNGPGYSDRANNLP
jgi:lipopolysaccharide/colanic/teichoic acid biosynthesis glycosyltransferase